MDQKGNAMHRVTRSTIALAVLLGAGMLPGQTAAQEPGRPITLIVGTSPSTGPDIVARTVAAELQKKFDQPVIVENRSGASGTIATQLVARAAPDGNTILVIVDPPFTANVSLLKNVPYDPLKTFVPIIEGAVGIPALAVHASVPVNSTAEFVAYAKERPGQINYGSPGIGTTHHLSMELFKLTAQVKLTHIPFRDSAGAISNMVGGHVSAMFLPAHVALPLPKDKIRLLGIASRQRVAAAPDLPTLAEQGFADFDADNRYGFLAPAATPPQIIARYNTAINEILRLPEVVDRLASQGLTAVGGTPERFRENLTKDLAKWQKVVKEGGLSPE
jgi:tripartite-type tricarboxylate transporter receptor subunit TctC